MLLPLQLARRAGIIPCVLRARCGKIKAMRFLEQFAAVLVLLVLFVGASYLKLKQTLHIERHYFTIQDRYRTPAIGLKPNDVERPPQALLLHGFSGSKEIMLQLGLALAEAGVHCFLIDFPGHGSARSGFGDSGTRLEFPRTVEAALSAISWLEARGMLEPERAVLVGHSMGAYVAIAAGRRRPDFLATVAISPVLAEADPHSPRNLLVLVGEHDFARVQADARRIIELATGLDKASLSSAFRSGDFARGTARGLQYFQHQTHTSMIFSPMVCDSISAWIEQAAGRKLRPNQGGKLALLSAAQFVAIVLIFFPWAHILGNTFRRLARDSNGQAYYEPELSPRYYFLAFGLTGLLAILLLHYFVPLSFLKLIAGDYLASFFFYIGVAGNLVLMASGRKLRLPKGLSLVLPLLFALVLFTLLYMSLGRFLSWQFRYLRLDEDRVWRAVVIFALLLPFFLGDEAFARSLQRRLGGWRGFSASIGVSLANKALLLGILLLAALALGAPWLVGIIGPGILLFALLLQIYSAYTYTFLDNPLITGAFNAACFAWLFATAFVAV